MMGNNLPHTTNLKHHTKLAKGPMSNLPLYLSAHSLRRCWISHLLIVKFPTGKDVLPSHKRFHNELENHHAINRVNQLFLWPFSMSQTVKLPEGTVPWIFSFSLGTYVAFLRKPSSQFAFADPAAHVETVETGCSKVAT